MTTCQSVICTYSLFVVFCALGRDTATGVCGTGHRTSCWSGRPPQGTGGCGCVYVYLCSGGALGRDTATGVCGTDVYRTSCWSGRPPQGTGGCGTWQLDVYLESVWGCVTLGRDTA